MRHARPDYQRFQDPEGKIPEDEPVMLFRAQDQYAAQTLRHYAALLINDNKADDKLIDAVEAHAREMEAWPVKKVPDL